MQLTKLRRHMGYDHSKDFQGSLLEENGLITGLTLAKIS